MVYLTGELMWALNFYRSVLPKGPPPKIFLVPSYCATLRRTFRMFILSATAFCCGSRGSVFSKTIPSCRSHVKNLLDPYLLPLYALGFLLMAHLAIYLFNIIAYSIFHLMIFASGSPQTTSFSIAH